jgi:serine/threonine protein kinase/tetratricopeptide (TPR) repeat protein
MHAGPAADADFQRVKDLFFLALDRDRPEDREAFLSDACGTDGALRERVEALLRRHAQADQFLEGPTSGDAVAADTVILEGPGSHIGPYKLIEQIGEGGFGIVFSAEQRQPVRRMVAVKILKPGLDTRQVVGRFEIERQALALMDHGNIARVLDGGETATGRPYFVMELVSGVPITRFCDEHRLTPRERLELFLPVCGAVQHAHQKGVIHRDLKPSNILVTTDGEGRPVPKVIDFGVAKAIGQRLTDESLTASFGGIIGTLEYMSPEQAEFGARDVDTRADVYSLGVLLYELLTGTTPYARRDFEKKGLLELLRVVREEEPPRPSTRLCTADNLVTLSANRRTDAKRLADLLRNELDWIVTKALEKDRTRRYQTANDFAADVQRYLAGEPVVAHPPSRGYRIRKYVRRHRGPVAAAGLILLSLLGGISGTTWGLLRAEQHWRLAETKEHEAVAERDAKDSAFKAERQARSDETQARKQAFAALRSMTADVIEQKFAQETVLTPDDRAFLRGVIAQFDAFAAIKGDDVDGRAMRAEGRYRIGSMRYRLGELKEAEQDSNEALIIRKQLVSDFPSRPDFREALVASHNLRGRLLLDTGRPNEAEQEFTEDFNLAKQLATEFPDRPGFRRLLAGSHTNRGVALHAMGRLPEAETEEGEALNIQKQLAADFPSHPEFRHWLARSHVNRCVILHQTGRLKEAEIDANEAVNLFKQLAADFRSVVDFHRGLARSYHNRGKLLRTIGRNGQAEKDYDEAVRLGRQLAADFPARPEFGQDLVLTYNLRGDLLRATGRLTGAEKDFDQAVSISKQLAADFPTHSEFRHSLANSHESRGVLLCSAGRFPEAESAHNKALGILKQLASDVPNQPELRSELADTCLNLATLYRLQRNWAAAERILLEGRPHRLAAIEANSRNSEYRRRYRDQLLMLTEMHARLLEPEDAMRVAGEARDLGLDVPSDAYNASCLLSRCIPIVAKHEKLDDSQRKQAVQFYGDAAIDLLSQAIGKGFRDSAYVMDDADLDPLRPREDFQKLIARLNPPVLARARYHIRLSEWEKAAVAYAEADLWSRPLDENAFACACMFLLRGDTDGYNRFCQELIEYAIRTKAPIAPYVLARTCAAARKSPVDPVRAVDWANQTVAVSQKPWDYHVLGMAQYRAGKFQQALQSLTKANVQAWRFRDINWFALALVHHSLDHPAEARQCWNRGILWLEREGPTGPQQPAKLPALDWLATEVLRREAEEVLQIKQSP